MSNNARVVPCAEHGWGEIGSAQYIQALAARCPPSLDMNPVLLKPQSDCSSQVVVLGRVDAKLSAMPWEERSEHLWPAVQGALERLRRRVDLVVIEGAGSPAEINLRARDIVNMRVAHEANARCLLVCDIDRGGAFAHLFGTWALLDEPDRSRIFGFVLNKFRGDARLLAPGPEMLQACTGVPTLGVIPMLHGYHLPEEDGQSIGLRDRLHPEKKNVVVISYPRISNLDEFAALSELEGYQLVWTQDPTIVQQADLLILPGSKNTKADLAWLFQTKIAEAIQAFAESGGPILGICGGLQMLGRELWGSEVAENAEDIPGLDLLGLRTTYSGEKTLRPCSLHFPELKEGPWQALSGLQLQGYEIHVGDTAPCPTAPATTLLPGQAWLNPSKTVLGIYAHGLFENPSLLTALFDAHHPTLDTTINAIANHLPESLCASLTGLLDLDSSQCQI